MSKNVSMNIRVDESTRLEAESIFEQLGLTMSGAINMFLKQVVREKAVPETARTAQRLAAAKKNRRK